MSDYLFANRGASFNDRGASRGARSAAGLLEGEAFLELEALGRANRSASLDRADGFTSGNDFFTSRGANRFASRSTSRGASAFEREALLEFEAVGRTRRSTSRSGLAETETFT
ncbi:MAG: hypothetical protein Q4G69_12965, partial [Planctomycetia bacterium]|nr:hypothetical protein [Planctomycetia bacterium]